MFSKTSQKLVFAISSHSSQTQVERQISYHESGLLDVPTVHWDECHAVNVVIRREVSRLKKWSKVWLASEWGTAHRSLCSFVRLPTISHSINPQHALQSTHRIRHTLTCQGRLVITPFSALSDCATNLHLILARKVIKKFRPSTKQLILSGNPKFESLGLQTLVQGMMTWEGSMCELAELDIRNCGLGGPGKCA